mgnify:CR=1 FL=1
MPRKFTNLNTNITNDEVCLADWIFVQFVRGFVYLGEIKIWEKAKLFIRN